MHTCSCGTAYAKLFKQQIKAFTVLCNINAFGGGAENRYAVFVQILNEIDCRLTSEGNYNAYGIFCFYDVHDVFGTERFEIQSICCVVVG